MVKGRVFFIGTVIFTAIVTVPQTCCLKDIKKYIFNTNGLGTYSFEYETTGGTYRREEGGILPGPSNSLVVRGEFGYIDPGGRLYSVKYVADENGYQPIISEDFTRYNDRRII